MMGGRLLDRDRSLVCGTRLSEVITNDKMNCAGRNGGSVYWRFMLQSFKPANLMILRNRTAICRLAILAMVLLGSVGTNVFGQPRPADFGQRWVRSHPLTLMGLQQSPQTLKMDKFLASNMNNMLVWWNDGNGKPIAAASSAGGMPWHALMVDGEGDERDRMANYA
jgi:hypothetical protein